MLTALDATRSPAEAARAIEAARGVATRRDAIRHTVQMHTIIGDMIAAAKRPDQTAPSFIREAVIETALRRLEEQQEGAQA